MMNLRLVKYFNDMFCDQDSDVEDDNDDDLVVAIKGVRLVEMFHLYLYY